MRYPWKRFRALLYWRPRFLEDIKFRGYIWKSIHTNYDQMIQEKKRLKALLANNSCDEYAMKRVADAHGNITNSWYAIQVYERALREASCKDAKITLDELAICRGYRETSYTLFYECRRLFLDAQVSNGRLSHEEWEVCMEYARNQGSAQDPAWCE